MFLPGTCSASEGITSQQERNYLEYVIIGVLSIFTSIISSVAGGGGGLLNAPAMLLVGFSPNVVVATQKAGGIGVNASALRKFHIQKGLIQWQLGLALSVLAIIASFIGTRVVFWFDEETIKNLIALIVIGVIPVMYLRRKDGITQRATSQLEKVIGSSLYGILLTIQAGFGGGIGTLNMFVLMGPLGLTALQANATKRLVGTVLTFTSMAFFIGSGYVDWKLAGVTFVATIIGGTIGAGIAIEKGSEFVKKSLMLVSIVIAITLLLN